ncbi:MAG: DUF4386 domain-containing protein [Chloroflexi bacterium]|nr:DUF4386 domain-containing protein [Chloroflexota bacterium]
MHSLNRLARIAAVLYLLIAVIGPFSIIYVPSTLVVAGDAAATTSNLAASTGLFQAGLVGYLIIFLAEIVLTVILFDLFKAVDHTLSMTAMAARLAMTIIHGLNLLSLFVVSLLASGAAYLSVFDPAQLDALVLLLFNAHDLGYTIGIVFLSLHVMVLGYLVYQSGFLPQVLGILLVLAGLGYVIDSAGLLFFDSYLTTPFYVAIPIAIAEVAFPLWLLIKGVKEEALPKAAPQPA